MGQSYLINKLLEKEIEFVVTRGGDGEKGNWMDEGSQKVQTSSSHHERIIDTRFVPTYKQLEN